MPLVSIIVPVYNVERYLRECLDSLLRQSYAETEILLINDGSTDSSGEICKEYAERHSNIRVFEKPNGGMSSARNFGLEKACGEWLVFVDSDDIIVPTFVEHALNNAIQHSAEISMLGFTDFTGVPQTKSEKVSNEVLPGMDAAEKMLYQNDEHHGLVPAPWGKIFQRQLFAQARFREGILYEDLDLIPIVVAGAERVCCCNETGYFYRTNPASITGRFNRKRFDVLDVVDRLVEYFEGEDLERAAEDRRLSASFNMLMVMGKHGYKDEQVRRRCIANIKRQRWASLCDSKVRRRNKVGILVSYLLGAGAFSHPFFARFLRR